MNLTQDNSANKIREIGVGLLLGLSGCALSYLVTRLLGAHYAPGFGDGLMIVAVFFFGSVAGWSAGLVCVMAAVGLGIRSGGLGWAFQNGVSTFVSLLIALSISRFTFFHRRPSLEPAMFFAGLVALAHLTVSFLFGLTHLGETMSLIRQTGLPLVAICTVAAGLFALALKVPRARDSARRAVLALLVFIGLLAIVWIADGRACLSAYSDATNVLAETFKTEVDYLDEPGAFLRAQQFIDETGTFENAVRCDLKAAAKRFLINRLSVVGRDGKVAASTDPAAVGYDMASDADSAKFIALNSGTRYASLRFRPAFVSADTNTWYKYVGLAFPQGGFVVVGDDITDYADHLDYLYELSMVDWPAGEKGSYILVNPKTDTVISALTDEWIGRPVEETGLKALDFTGKGEGDDVRGKVLGVDSLVRKLSLDFVDMDAYMAVPLDEIMYNRNLSTIVFLFVLTAIFIFGSMLLAKIARQQESLKAFYAKDEERRRHDLELAQNIQHSALPSAFVPFPGSDDVELYAQMRTAKEVGGDFFDFYPLGARRLGIVVADVSDKGVPAALFMMKAKAALQSAALSGKPPADVMAEANAALCENNTSNMFVTAWIGVLDLDSGALEYVSAGHNPPYVRRADGSVEALAAPRALVLACMEGIRYKSCRAELKPGDRLFLYTDGVTEATATDGSLFGEERLEDRLKTCGLTARATCDDIVAAVDRFATGAPQADDITVFTVLYHGPAQPKGN